MRKNETPIKEQRFWLGRGGLSSIRGGMGIGFGAPLSIMIGRSYLDAAAGDVVAAVKAHPDSSTDILIAHISIGDPALADRLADAID